jgi:hypothetical protein
MNSMRGRAAAVWGLALACFFGALTLGGCVAVTRSASYGLELADAQPIIDGRPYRIYVHPYEDTILLQRPILTGMAQGFVRGATFHTVGAGEAYDPWKQAAKEFLSPIGCEATDVYSLGGDAGTWEARFKCPPSVDLRALVKAQRAELRAGAPLHP